MVLQSNTSLNFVTVGELLGQGGFGSVFHCTLHDGRHAVVKLSPYISEALMEVGALLLCQGSDYVVKLLDHFPWGNLYCTVLEWCPSGDLWGLFASSGQFWMLKWELIAVLTRQVVQGVHAVHRQGLVHNDIKPANILQFGNGAFHSKLCDFGLACRIGSTCVNVGTLGHQAPELLAESGLMTPASDVFSLGVFIYWMATGELPFGQDASRTPGRTLAGDFEIPDWVDDELSDLIQRCMATNPVDRIGLVEMLDHPFMRTQLGSLTNPLEPKTLYVGPVSWAPTRCEAVMVGMQEEQPQEVRHLLEVQAQCLLQASLLSQREAAGLHELLRQRHADKTQLQAKLAEVRRGKQVVMRKLVDKHTENRRLVAELANAERLTTSVRKEMVRMQVEHKEALRANNDRFTEEVSTLRSQLAAANARADALQLEVEGAQEQLAAARSGTAAVLQQLQEEQKRSAAEREAHATAASLHRTQLAQQTRQEMESLTRLLAKTQATLASQLKFRPRSASVDSTAQLSTDSSSCSSPSGGGLEERRRSRCGSADFVEEGLLLVGQQHDGEEQQDGRLPPSPPPRLTSALLNSPRPRFLSPRPRYRRRRWSSSYDASSSMITAWQQQVEAVPPPRYSRKWSYPSPM